MKPRPRFPLRPWQVVLIACLVYLIAIFITYKNPLEFVWIGSKFDATLYARDAEGYDGQFVYYIARDFAGAAQHLDVPAYRYQRIVYPLLGWALSLGGNPALLPWVLVGINLAALVIGTALLELLLIREKASRWFALSYGLFAGVFVAVRFCTTEPLAYAFVLAALVAAQRGSVARFAVWLCLAMLTKETTIFFGIGYGLYFLTQRQFFAAALLGAITLFPFAVWQAVLYAHFGTFGIGSGGAGATPFEIVPFNGLWKTLGYGLNIYLITALVVIPAVVIPAVWALWRTVRDALAGRHHPYVYLLFANAAILPFVPFSTVREPFGILRFIPGLVITILLYAALRRLRRPLRYSLLWIVFGVRVVG